MFTLVKAPVSLYSCTASSDNVLRRHAHSTSPGHRGISLYGLITQLVAGAVIVGYNHCHLFVRHIVAVRYKPIKR